MSQRAESTGTVKEYKKELSQIERGTEMVELPKDEEIKAWLSTNDLTAEQLDEKDGEIEAWQKDCQEMARGFWNYLHSRFSGIEKRLSILEEQKKG